MEIKTASSFHGSSLRIWRATWFQPTAHALVATVAGLGVAIPSLFGYNYLQTHIKGVGADMNVFVDEFVTKMAENYGG